MVIKKLYLIVADACQQRFGNKKARNNSEQSEIPTDCLFCCRKNVKNYMEKTQKNIKQWWTTLFGSRATLETNLSFVILKIFKKNGFLARNFIKRCFLGIILYALST